MESFEFCEEIENMGVHVIQRSEVQFLVGIQNFFFVPGLW